MEIFGHGGIIPSINKNNYFNSISNFTVIGNGLAGLLTTSLLYHLFPNSSITNISSQEIGTIGVGEGSTPSLNSFIIGLGYDLEEFLSYTNGTKKQGIDFIGWDGNPSSSFLLDFGSPENFALHSDSILACKFLESKLQDNVTFVNENITSIESNENGDITTINTISGSYNTEFVFDCSGFNKLIIGNKLSTEWVDTSDLLKTNKTITFTLPSIYDDSIELYPTKAISMNAGWMFQIPLQNRTGAGYVFDSNYLTDEEAKIEVEQYLNQKIEINHTIPFTPGYFKENWVNNCVGIGLSTVFFEPLEATSIDTSIEQLLILFEKNLTKNNYNNQINKLNYNVKEFLRFHYHCSKTGTSFWDSYSTIPLTPVIKYYIEHNKLPYSSSGFFPLYIWEQVYNGNFLT